MPKALSRPQANLLYAGLYVLLVLLVFTVGFRYAGWTWADSFYMVVITAFSVGFGEVHPVTDPWLRIWTMALIVLGCTGVIFITGTLVQLLTESQINRVLGGKRMESVIGKLNHHAIVCGFGRLGRVLAGQLEQGGMPFVIVDQSPERVAEAREMNWLALQGEATDEAVLRSVGIEHAKVLASVLSNDAANVFITLSAREMNPDIQIVARAELPSTERKLLQAGANRVVLPAHIGADRIAHMILHPNARELFGGSTHTASAFEHHLTGLGLDLEEIEVGPTSPFVKRTVGDVETEAAGRFLAVAILRRNGGTELNPDRAAQLHPGDALVVLRREGAG